MSLSPPKDTGSIIRVYIGLWYKSRRLSVHDHYASLTSPLQVKVRSQENNERNWDRDERVQAATTGGGVMRAGLLGGARAATATRSCGTGSGNFEGRADDG